MPSLVGRGESVGLMIAVGVCAGHSVRGSGIWNARYAVSRTSVAMSDPITESLFIDLDLPRPDENAKVKAHRLDALKLEMFLRPHHRDVERVRGNPDTTGCLISVFAPATLDNNLLLPTCQRRPPVSETHSSSRR